MPESADNNVNTRQVCFIYFVPELHRAFGVITGVVSVAFGALLSYDIGFVHGLFTANPQWTPQ
ncbi:MAG TPA: hypothetical protein VIK01_14675 [Polyangiaceae bacterium]